MKKQVEVKRKCCKSSPRCKRCPVVFKRLSRQGLATLVEGRNYAFGPGLGKRELKAARHAKG